MKLLKVTCGPDMVNYVNTNKIECIRPYKAVKNVGGFNPISKFVEDYAKSVVITENNKYHSDREAEEFIRKFNLEII